MTKSMSLAGFIFILRDPIHVISIYPALHIGKMQVSSESVIQMQNFSGFLWHIH